MLWRAKETGTQKFLCKSIDTLSITLFAGTESDRSGKDHAMLHAIENAIALMVGADTPSASQRAAQCLPMLFRSCHEAVKEIQGERFHTRRLASLYEAFAPAEARRLPERLKVQDTPKQGRKGLVRG